MCRTSAVDGGMPESWESRRKQTVLSWPALIPVTSVNVSMSSRSLASDARQSFRNFSKLGRLRIYQRRCLSTNTPVSRIWTRIHIHNADVSKYNDYRTLTHHIITIWPSQLPNKECPIEHCTCREAHVKGGGVLWATLLRRWPHPQRNLFSISVNPCHLPTKHFTIIYHRYGS